jgi:MFS family permease
MTNYLKTPVINISKERYLKLLMILAPLLNFLSGITFDLHAPSLPAIASYFSSSVSAAKSTITLTLLGFSIGCLFFGVLIDIFGRRPVILIGLLTYTIASLFAPFCPTIECLLLVRLIQGFSVSTVGIGCRTIIMDSFTGHKFKVAILYTSLAFGIGPIIAPFIGGYLQDHFGWHASFVTYGLASFILLIMVFLYIKESQTNKIPFSFKTTGINYVNIIRHDAFIPGIIIVGLSQYQQLIYTTIGAFLVENVLHYSAVTYGNTALLVSCGYLLGTLTNRMLLRYYPVDVLISLGFKLLFTGILMLMICWLCNLLNLVVIVLPMMLLGFSHGFIFINTYTCCLRTSNTPGAVVSIITASLMVIGTIGIYIISLININNLGSLAAIFAVGAIIQLLVFIFSFRHFAKEV